MKNLLVFLFLSLIVGCNIGPVIILEPEPTPTVIGQLPTATPDFSNDPRLKSFDALSTEWINYPVIGGYTVSRKIAKDEKVLAKCNKKGYSYMFYNDEAVIGFEPFPGHPGLMAEAIRSGVESHNLFNPDDPQEFINVPADYWTPNTSNDPILGKWQVAFCNDAGEFTWGPITAEELFNWELWHNGMMDVQLANFNLFDNEPIDSHIVWGTD